MNTQIQQAHCGQEMQERHQHSEAKPIEVYRPRRWPANVIFSAAGLIGVGGLGWLFWASAAFAEITNPISFITVGCFSLLLIVVAIAQFGLYWSQRDFLNAQWNAMNQSLAKTDDIIEQMKDQGKAMRDTVVATEKNAAMIRATEAPYFGIIGIDFLGDLKIGERPVLRATFFNGGRTPAWHFYAVPALVLGDSPDGDRRWELRQRTIDMAAAFFPEKSSHNLEFESADFVYTEEIEKLLEADQGDYLFAVIRIEYRDHLNATHPNHTFKCIWDHQSRMFSDFETA